MGNRAPRPLRPEPLWARVDANRARLATFIVLFVAGSSVLLTGALVVVPGTLLSLLSNDSEAYFATFRVVVFSALGGSLALGALLAAVQIANAEHWVLSRFKGHEPAPEEALAMRAALDDLAIAAGLARAPRLVVIEAPPESVNALAAGSPRTEPVIGVTRGFLERLDANEQRAVAAALIARLIAGDVMFGTALAALMGPLVAFRTLHRAAGEATGGVVETGCADPGCADGCSGCAHVGDIDSDGCGGTIGVVLFVVLVAVITYVAVVTAAWIVTLWGRALHRTAYEKADAEGMLLLKDPGPMLTALTKVVSSSNAITAGDSSYDSIFYAATSGTARVERVERRRHDRLREVVGVEGLAAAAPGTDES